MPWSGLEMPEAVFVVQLDDLQGFVVRQRHPTTLSLNETTLNLVYYEHEKEKQEDLKYTEIEGLRIASYTQVSHPGWIVSFVLGTEEELEPQKTLLSGMGRLILELMTENPEEVDLEQILHNASMLEEPNTEQKCAEIFLTPSSALLLEKLQSEGAARAATLSMWLKSQVQSDTIDLRESIGPLMRSGLVKVELVGKTSETVFLVKDVFGYRAPPIQAVLKAKEQIPNIADKYREEVKSFFSPSPPAKGYNPTLPVDDPNSPILEDRERISRVLSDSLQYAVLKCLREQPFALAEIAQRTALPESVVQNSLWAMESEKVVTYFEEAKLWGLVTNPRIESFLPEYVLPILSKKIAEKELNQETAKRYLELLVQTWSEQSD